MATPPHTSPSPATQVAAPDSPRTPLRSGSLQLPFHPTRRRGLTLPPTHTTRDAILPRSIARHTREEGGYKPPLQ